MNKSYLIVPLVLLAVFGVLYNGALKDMKAKAQTSNVEAYEYYLRGRQFMHQYRRPSIDLARQMFTKAIALDPTYARAHGGLADCHSIECCP